MDESLRIKRVPMQGLGPKRPRRPGSKKDVQVMVDAMRAGEVTEEPGVPVFISVSECQPDDIIQLPPTGNLPGLYQVGEVRGDGRVCRPVDGGTAVRVPGGVLVELRYATMERWAAVGQRQDR